MRRGIPSLLGMSIAMAGLSGFGMSGMQSLRVPQRRIRFIQSSYRHNGVLPKGCRKETVRLKFKKDEKLVNGHLISVDVDLVYATLKGRDKKLRKYRMELAEYIFNRWIADLQKDEMFIIEPIQNKNETTI